MTGNQHLVSGYSLLTLSYISVRLIQEFCPIEKIIDCTNTLMKVMKPDNIYWLPVDFLLFTIGLLLPDIDSPKSKLGRYVHVNIEHRKYLHTFYFLLLIFVLTKNPWIVFGAFLHLFCDSPSKCGVCWFNPVTGYRYYGNSGKKIKKNHVFVLYKNETQAWILCVVLVMLTLFSISQYHSILFTVSC